MDGYDGCRHRCLGSGVVSPLLRPWCATYRLVGDRHGVGISLDPTPSVSQSQWKIGTNRVIEWQGPADTEYSLIVVDQKTQQTIGIIGTTEGAEAGDRQHGFAWVVGDYATPVGSIQKVLPPGNYEILATYASDSQYMVIPAASFTAI